MGSALQQNRETEQQPVKNHQQKHKTSHSVKAVGRAIHDTLLFWALERKKPYLYETFTPNMFKRRKPIDPQIAKFSFRTFVIRMRTSKNGH